MDRYPARAVPSTMADIRQQPTYDNLGLTRDPGVQPVPLSRSTLHTAGPHPARPARPLSIATSSVFIVTVDFIVTAVNNSLTAARLLLACARERCTATCALSVACVARAKTCFAFGSGVFCVFFTVLLVVSTVNRSVAVSGSTPVPAEPLLDITSLNGACHFALTGSSASAQPPGRPPGNLGTQPDGCFTGPSVDSSFAGAEITGCNSTPDAKFPPCPSPKCRRHGQPRVGGVASLGCSDRRPAPLASAAPGLLHSAIRCGPTPTLRGRSAPSFTNKLPRTTLGTGLARTGTNTGTPREPPKRLLRGRRGT